MEQWTEVDARPSARVVFSMANQRLKYWQVFGEWIDNALDAFATTVSIECQKQRVEVEDDGIGCPDVRAMFIPGEHLGTGERQGIFGVGGKDAALWMGGLKSTMSITTTHQGIRRRAWVAWEDYVKSDGKIQVRESPYDEAARQGTKIVITDTERSGPRAGEDWSATLAQLGYIYTPALTKGIQIKLKKGAKWEPLVRWTPPQLEGDVVEGTLTVEGKTAHVRCGVVKAGERHERPGFTYYHKNRVISPASAYGCGTHLSTRVCGEVWLEGQWPRTKNKDALKNDHPTVVRLFEEVSRLCEPALQRADEACQELVSEHVSAQVNSTLNALVANAKARRSSPRSKSGTKRPTGEGGRHKRAASIQGGHTFSAGGGSGFRVSPARLGGVRTGQLSGPDVLLNLDNPAVEAAYGSAHVREIVILACSTIAAEHCAAPAGQFVLKGFAPGATMEDFGDVLGQLLAGYLTLDGKPALKVVDASDLRTA